MNTYSSSTVRSIYNVTVLYCLYEVCIIRHQREMLPRTLQYYSVCSKQNAIGRGGVDVDVGVRDDFVAQHY